MPLPKSRFLLMAERCDQCLMGKNKIVSNARRAEIIRETRLRDCHFICHKAHPLDVACRGHFDATGGGNLARIMGRINGIAEVTAEQLAEALTDRRRETREADALMERT